MLVAMPVQAANLASTRKPVTADASRSIPASMRPEAKQTGSKSTVVVQKGDSVYVLAKRYGISSREIIETNKLKAPYVLKLGQKVVIPVSRVHKVKQGDTLYGISRHYGVDLSSLAKENSLQKPYHLLVGQKLRVPPRSYREHKDSDTVVRKPQKPPMVAEVKTEFAPRISKGQFTWPLKGKVISSFGAKEGGIYNDGINIAATEGSKVYAAADGEVVYADDQLKGYGNLLVIQHKDGWVTAYAHNRQFTVRKGNKVKKGQLIAYVGASGTVEKPQLHFAMRKGRKALDPMKYLPS